MEELEKKIISLDAVSKLVDTFTQSDQCSIAGGCFDILHVGHVTFLQHAKKQGHTLLILLEADDTITKLKGEHRPYNTQYDRAIVLAALTCVDYVILLQPHMQDSDYDNLVLRLKPAIISTTKGDKFRFHKERQAKRIGATVKDVTDIIPEKSSTKLSQVMYKKIYESQ